MEIMQIGAYSKRSYEKTKANLYFIFTRFVVQFSKFPSSYIVSWSRLFFYFLHPCKGSNVSCFDDIVNFTIVQKVIASRVCIFSSCGRVLLKELFFLFVILKAFQLNSLARQKRARDENVYVWFDGFLHFTSFCSLLSYWVDSQFFTQKNLVFGFHFNISFEFRLQ